MAQIPVRKISRDEHRRRIHRRVRQTLIGTSERPRLSVYRSLAHLYVQVIDDSTGRTLASAGSNDKEMRKQTKGGGNVAAARLVGKTVAERALQKGISQVVFDRGGYRYHGRVKALADAAREAGLKF